MDAITTTSAVSVESVQVSAFGDAGELFISERVAEFTARGLSPADACEDASYWADCGEGELSTWYCEVARRLGAAQDADLVTVATAVGVVREGVALDVDEAQWRADNAVGLELGRRPLTVDPATVETQAQFDERMARGYAEREARRPVTDPFRRLPVHEDIAF